MLSNCFLLLAIINFEILPGYAGIENHADKLFHEYWEFTLCSEPEFATTAGDHRFDNRLNNYTLFHYQHTKKNSEKISFPVTTDLITPCHPSVAHKTLFSKLRLTAMRNAAKGLLNRAEPESDMYDNLQVLIAEIEYKLDLLHIKSYLFPISYLDGPPGSLIALLNYIPMASMIDFQNLVARYNAFPQQVEEIIDLLKVGIRTNMVLHERSLRNYEKQVTSFITEPKKSAFYEPFEKLASFAPPQELESHQKVAADSITQSVNPALQRLADFIQNEYRQHLRPDIASTSLPNGPEYYQKSLNFYVSVKVTVQEIHDMGLAEVHRISKDMDTIIRSFGLDISKQEFNEQLRSNASMFFKTPEEAVKLYTDLLHNQIEPLLPQFFKNIPETQLQVKHVPEQLAGGPIGYYEPSSPDGSSKGTIFIDTTNLPKYQTVTLSLHEGEPGHHLQSAFINEQEGVPEFRKRLQYPKNAALLEGWALYSEYLGIEMNLYKDKYMLYGHFSQEILRACRLVMDTGMHALGWSQQQAFDFMVQHTAASKKRVKDEVDRYITWPGQACSYKFGEIKIKNFRAKAEAALGNRFNLKDFHDVVLRSYGPLSFLEKQVNRYIAAASI